MKKASYILILAIAFIFANPAYAALDPFQSFTGNVKMSTDGFGSTTNSGMIQASVPAGSTILAAYLYSATNGIQSTPGVSLDGSPVTFGPRVANGTACCSLASFRADVTSIVAAMINGGPGGIYNFSIDETLFGGNVDGEALVVVYENPSLPVATVGILDGFASVTGDTTSINFADPLDPSDPGFFAEMVLGIGFSCCNQQSEVKVNGQLVSNVAGNNDDGNQVTNGALITVGGFDDPFTPTNPTYTQDKERYDLSGYVANGDTSIVVDTINASQDDNIFLAGFYVSGIAGINQAPPPVGPRPNTQVPEPSTLFLAGLGLMLFAFKGKRAR